MALRLAVSTRARRALAALCLTTSLTIGQQRNALAQETNAVALDWVRGEGAESCVSSSELSNKLRMALAEVNVSPTVRIEGLIERDTEPKQYRVRLRLLDPSHGTAGVRELTSADEDCARLTPSIVLVLAVLAELGAGATLTFDAKSEANPTAQRAVPAHASEASAKSAPVMGPQANDARPFSIEPWAALALGLGFAPQRALGPMVGLRVRTPWLIALVWRAAYWPAGRTPIVSPGAASASVSFDVVQNDLDLCIPLPRSASWWAAGCWGAALIARNARVHGLGSSHDSLRFTGTAHAAFELGYAPTPRVLLSLLGSLVAFRRHDTYAFDDVNGRRQELFRQNHFAGSFAMTVGTRL